MQLLRFVLVEHLGAAWLAAKLFVVGALLALPAVQLDLELLLGLPRGLYRWIRGLFGSRPGLARLTLVIFAFNGTAISLYLASGFHPLVPEAISFLTGFNVSAILFLAAREPENDDAWAPGPGAWIPGRTVTALCGLAVLCLELPSFWFAVGMGIEMGKEVLAGETGYLGALAVRLRAYALLLLPALLVSAVCEAVAIRGMSGLSSEPAD